MQTTLDVQRNGNAYFLSKDWNHFLLSLANLQLCARANGTAMEMVSSPPFAKEEVCGTVLLNSTQSPPSITQLSLWVPLAVMDSSNIHSLSDLCLHGTLLASQLGLTGQFLSSIGKWCTFHVMLNWFYMMKPSLIIHK